MNNWYSGVVVSSNPSGARGVPKLPWITMRGFPGSSGRAVVSYSGVTILNPVSQVLGVEGVARGKIAGLGPDAQPALPLLGAIVDLRLGIDRPALLSPDVVVASGADRIRDTQ